MHCHAKHLLLPRPLPPWKPLTATLKPFKTHITATQNTYYCHTLCHTRNLLETFYCHAKHLLLPRPLPPCKPLLPRQNLSKHISLPRPYHTRNPLLPRCSLSVPHYCHTTATPLPYMSASRHPSRIGECQILRVGQFFMVEYLANTKL